MKNDRDPTLQTLFDIAGRDLGQASFTDDVMRRIDKSRQRRIMIWVGIGLVLIPCIAFLTAPLLDATSLLTQILPISLVDLENQWVSQLLSPINSIAGALGLGFLVLRAAARKLFR